MSLFQTVVRRNKPKRNVGLIYAGPSYSLAIQKNGKVWAWGNNTSGNIGDNTIVSKITPVSIVGTVKTFCKISAGGTSQSLAIDKNGRAWAWGGNNVGQLGDNTIVSKRTPVSVAGAIKTFCNIAGGSSHSLAIDKNGRAWAWGSGTSGQLGDNTIINKSTPVSVAGAIKTFCQISGGTTYSVALDKNGRAWAWGINNIGQLGDNTTVSKRTPVSVVGTAKTFCQISSADNFALAIDKNGRAWAWGNNQFGQLGDNTIVNKSTPVSIVGTIKTFCQISGGSTYSLALDKNGRAWAWGFNFFGQLGDNTTVSKNTPVSVAGAIKTFCKISAGVNHALAIDKNGRAWAWGNNNVGQIGNNTTNNKSTPVSIAGPTRTFCTVGANLDTSFAIDKNGKLRGWGGNYMGQIGDNSLIQKISPVGIAGSIKTFCKISSTLGSFALDKNGRAWAWGNNTFGQLGDNTVVGKSTPVSVAGAVKTFCEISGGAGDTAFSLALDKNGRAWAWGNNVFGQLGDNTVVGKSTPVSVAGAVKTFCKISAGASFSLALDKNGRAWAWGDNDGGNLGDNTIVSKRTPVSVAGAIKTFCKIAANSVFSNFSAAIDKNGRVWTWGFNFFGNLGDNTVVSRSTPVSVAGAIKTFCEISLGESHVVALDKNGRAWAWGNNINGTLGDNTIVDKSTPVSVAGAVKTFCKIIASAQLADFGDAGHTLAIDKNGRVWAWGPQNSFCLGVNVPVTPVQVCNI